MMLLFGADVPKIDIMLPGGILTVVGILSFADARKEDPVSRGSMNVCIIEGNMDRQTDDHRL